jgi:two-component system CheB/CheR fusion protein
MTRTPCLRLVPPAPATRGLKILLVDDNVDATDTLAELLRTVGHRVVGAYDGVSGLAWFECFMPDLAILDLGLPELDGFELAERVRSDMRFRALPLIALSAYDAPRDRARSRSVGFDHHLSKPLRWKQLQDLLAGYAAAAEGVEN